MGIVSSKRDPFAVTVLSRNENFANMEYAMLYDTRQGAVPQVPPPTRRRSLAQRFITHRYQNSHYFSTLKYYGLRPDYPVFHGFKIIPAAPGSNQTPVITNMPGRTASGSARGGTMGAPPRFKKALPSKITAFNPPVYGS